LEEANDEHRVGRVRRKGKYGVQTKCNPEKKKRNSKRKK